MTHHNKKIVIAHRGASGYLPEHTLPGTAMAYAMGADYIEPDVVLSKDAVPMVLHDIQLETTTNVEQIYPDRQRPDGHWYAIDFTLAEIKSLKVTERRNPKTNQSVFVDRFPQDRSTFTVPTLAEQIELVQGLNKSTGKNIGLYPELKSPQFHHEHDLDFGKIMLELLNQYGYSRRSDNVFVQCFDPSYLKRLRTELKTDLALIQLLAPNEWEISSANYDTLLTADGLKEIATFADGIGLWMLQIKDEPDHTPSHVINSNIIEDAHQAGLLVHVYTFRKDSLPTYVNSFEELHRLFYYDLNVDGIFTDFSDLTAKFLQQHH